MEILENFGVQGNLLLAQIVNFLIIFFVLRKFFYKPIASALEERKKTIAESLENAEKVQKSLEDTEIKTTALLKDARQESQTILAEAKKEAREIAETAKLETKKQINELMEKAHAQIELERSIMKKDVEKQAATLAIAIVQKVLARDLKGPERDSLTKESLIEARDQIQ